MELLTPEQLFRTIDREPNGSVRWCEAPPCEGPGVYVISIPDMSNVQFDERFDAERHRWNCGQRVIYIGRGKRLSRRLSQFYRHIYGRRSPHRGGQAILLVKSDKVIHWLATEDYVTIEHRLLEAFKCAVGAMPFGNRMRSARMAGVASWPS